MKKKILFSQWQIWWYYLFSYLTLLSMYEYRADQARLLTNQSLQICFEIIMIWNLWSVIIHSGLVYQKLLAER